MSIIESVAKTLRTVNVPNPTYVPLQAINQICNYSSQRESFFTGTDKWFLQIEAQLAPEVLHLLKSIH